MKRLAVLAVLAASPAFAQSVVQIDELGTGLGGVATQPELAFAATDTRVLEIAGGTVTISMRGAQPAVTETTAQFWAAAGVTAMPGEHRVWFDAPSGHWFVSADDASHRYLAVSANDDPLAAWTAMTLPPATGTRLAVDAVGVYLVGAHAGTTDILAIPLADAVAATTANVTQLTAAELDLVPANGNTTAPELLVGRGTSTGGDTTIDVWTLTWTGNVPALTGPSSIDLGMAFDDPPATAVQMTGSPLLVVGDGRIRSAYVSGDQLWAIAATQIGGRAGAFDVQIGVPAGALLAIDPIGDPAADLVNPELAADIQGDIGIVVTEVTAGMRIVLTGRNGFFFGAPLAQPNVPTNGTGPYSCAPQSGVSSYAPYAAIAPDGDGGFWADVALAGSGDCGFQTAPVEFFVEGGSPGDDFPVDEPGDAGFDPPGGGHKPLAGCCSSSGGGSSIVLAGLVIGLARARRRARAQPTRPIG